MVSARGVTSKILEPAGPLVYMIGESLPDITFELDYDSGGPLVLTNMVATVAVARLKGVTPTITGTCTITDASNGICIFSWGSFTFTSPGTYLGQVKVTNVSNRPIFTQKFLIEVVESVAGL